MSFKNVYKNDINILNLLQFFFIDSDETLQKTSVVVNEAINMLFWVFLYRNVIKYFVENRSRCRILVERRPVTAQAA